MKEIGNGLNGWLTPEGELKECNYGDHKVLAKELVIPNHHSPQDDLWERSFINIGSGSGGSTLGWSLENEPTEKQKEWLLGNTENFDEIQLNDLRECKEHWGF